MEPVVILEQYRLDPVRAERVPVYTLVEHPFRPGSSREITREEAAAIIIERKLKRYKVQGKEEGEDDEKYVVGHVWDTARRAFQRKWSVKEYGKRKRRICLGRDGRKDIAPVASRKVTNYRKAIHKAIENQLGE